MSDESSLPDLGLPGLIRQEVRVRKVARLLDTTSDRLLRKLKAARIPILGTGQGTRVMLVDLLVLQRQGELAGLERVLRNREEAPAS